MKYLFDELLLDETWEKTTYQLNGKRTLKSTENWCQTLVRLDCARMQVLLDVITTHTLKFTHVLLITFHHIFSREPKEISECNAL